MTEVEQGYDILKLLGALQLGDSFFPSGRYTLSHGLESFAQAKVIDGLPALEEMLHDYVVHAVGPSEAVAVASANRSATTGDLTTIIAVDQLLFAMKLPAEASAASVRSGRQVLASAGRLGEDSVLAAYQCLVSELVAPGNHAVVFGLLSAAWGLSPVEAAAIEIHAYATGLMGAALRLVRIDHDDAQGVLRRLQPVAAEAAWVAAQTDYREMSAFAPVIEIMQMRHENSRLRLFAS
ncbi:MAG: urease accessory protein UreF [Actinomycetes bacterium]